MKKRSAIVMVIVVLLASLLLVPGQSNELSKRDSEAGFNGSFETADSGYPVNWAFFPDPESNAIYKISVDTTRFLEGSQSLELATDQSERTIGFRSSRVPVEPGRTYRISFSMQNDGCALQVRRIVQDASGTDNRRSEIIVDTSISTNKWQTFEESLEVFEGEASVVLVFLADGPGTLWIDNVQVEEVTE